MSDDTHKLKRDIEKSDTFLEALAEAVKEKLQKGVTFEIPRGPPRPLRAVKEYIGDPVMGNPRGPSGGPPYPLPYWENVKGERCGIEEDIRGELLKCDIKLMVVRIFPEYWERDYYVPTVGQLKYDKENPRFYFWCPRHGPFPPQGEHKPAVRVGPSRP